MTWLLGVCFCLFSTVLAFASFAAESTVPPEKAGATVRPAPLASALPSASPEEVPFWKAKKDIYRRMREERYIAVSAKAAEAGPEKKLTVQSAGIIHAPVDFVHREISDYEAYSKFLPYMQESSFDKTTHNLFVHGAVMGFHVRMTMHLDEREIPEGHVIDGKTISGDYLGMTGQIIEKRLDPDHTEIALTAHYAGASLGVPQFLLNWGLEFAGHRAASEMRRHIEDDFIQGSKKR